MAAQKLHHSLPAPVVHAGFSVPQSKSHVLAGVQDAYWSDDEAEDAECPLCLEEMDISDLGFKPCVCGYQICRFCWHHIKENLNSRCPACRRLYSDEAVEFKPIPTQDHKRLTQQKKQRERERKELDALGRRHLANVRVVQRNVVYVVGIGPRFAKEELIPTLRSNEYFGQYGKINKILLTKRNSPGGGGPVVGLYITYHRREDAARCIAAVDGTASPGGGRDVMRASYGTTKVLYGIPSGCVSCSDHSCMNLHEWGDEKDCFTKEDLTTLKHTMKATERPRPSSVKKADEDAGLPRGASWGQRGTSAQFPSIAQSSATASGSTSRQTRRNVPSSRSKPPTDAKTTAVKPPDRKPQVASRPATPTVDATRTEAPVTVKSPKLREVVAGDHPSPSPAPSITTASDLGSVQDSATLSPRPPSAAADSNAGHTRPPPPPKAPLAPPGLSAPAAPPGIPPPPGISTPSRPPRLDSTSPQTPILASDSAYQMSSAARQLLDDVKARRESAVVLGSVFSPFPDFDRMLQNLSGEDGGGFSFNLDTKLADRIGPGEPLLDFDSTANVPFRGTYIDAFPALRNTSPYISPATVPSARPIFDPAVARAPPNGIAEKPRSNGYFGSFDPFAENSGGERPRSNAASPSKTLEPLGDEERKVSRFGFARGRQSTTAASSPAHVTSPLQHETQPLFLSNDPIPSYHLSRADAQPSFPSSPAYQHAPPVMMSPNPGTYFAPPGRTDVGDLSEAQLRNFIKSRQTRPQGDENWHGPPPGHFEDPAIMSASFGPQGISNAPLPPVSFGPPPGLSAPQARPVLPPMMQLQSQPPLMSHEAQNNRSQAPVVPSPSSVLSPEDFPALSATPSMSQEAPGSPAVPREKPIREPNTPVKTKAAERAERKAAKKAAAAADKTVSEKEKSEPKATLVSKTEAEPKVEAVEAKGRGKSAAAEAKTQVKAPKQSVQPPTLGTADTAKPPIPPAKRPAESSESEKPTSLKKTSKVGEQAKKAQTASASQMAIAPTSTPVDKSAPEVVAQGPLLSKKPKKNKPAPKLPKLPVKDDDNTTTPDDSAPAYASATSRLPALSASSVSNSRSQSVDHQLPTSVERLLEDIDAMHPELDLASHPFFDMRKLQTPARMPLEYAPLVHALSALSVGGGSFANNMPSGSIDNAVSSFQQLLETLTQTISDLLRLLPRTTWDDSSSFDNVLRDMLKGDDFLDDGGEENPGKEDEVAALTLALERRARWMEVQLSKLEELHRDINTAAVRAVMSFNDVGWDTHRFLPRVGNTLKRFDSMGFVTDDADGKVRPMTADELEKKLLVAKEAAVFAETELREAMERFQHVELLQECS